ncbi:hypothetical protein [Pseudooceanicola sp. MF1-13]|uniref:hypothetical protein n=1 Tax=Pseudooceanicola sp. MF1-13 TaxID=3379095 RepID=UPI003892BD56
MKYAIFALCCAAGAAQADQYSEVMNSYARETVQAWTSDPMLVNAIKSQNARTGGLSQDQIDEMDRQWRNEVGMSDRPIVDPVLFNPVSDHLRNLVSGSAGAVTEVFIMDGKGLNVAASDATSDYWQGDEEKFTETYAVGPDALHISNIEFDESTQTYQGQISMPISDPESGAVIGAMTVGLNAEMLF